MWVFVKSNVFSPVELLFTVRLDRGYVWNLNFQHPKKHIVHERHLLVYLNKYSINKYDVNPYKRTIQYIPATYKIYKNGVEVVTENHTISGTTWTGIPSFLKPVVGAASINSTLGRYNNIRVGEITNYNRPLSATEIDNNYNSTKTNYGL